MSTPLSVVISTQPMLSSSLSRRGLEHQHNEVWEFVPSDVEEDLEDHWITDFPKEEEYQVISLEEDLKDYPYQELDQKPQLVQSHYA
ncbi:hypothetical protein PPACK8108_LOCUS5170 [Phakopsora pachyrhizi]|uniref:Uncharacterized protein n=1 Tax=Phakopsora pachyrhizi TaxID=170000 RepID=A0AAV0AQ50_PHAPC|nr:hypothetical protein PPACK8108_LOCUS5170 [Phakopsora pachyrhizi]